MLKLSKKKMNIIAIVVLVIGLIIGIVLGFVIAVHTANPVSQNKILWFNHEFNYNENSEEFNPLDGGWTYENWMKNIQ